MIKKLRHFKKRGETPVQTLVRVHHEAYLVETLGLKASGVPYANFLKMVNAGMIRPKENGKRNQYQVVVNAARVFSGMSNPERAQAKDWSADKWREILAAERTVPDLVPGVAPETIVVPGMSGLTEQRWGGDHSAQDPHAPIEEAPAEMQGYLRAAFKQACDRAGMYCQALGDNLAQGMDKVLSGEGIAEWRLMIIREEVSRTIRDGGSKEELAARLRERTGDFVRDWNRVAVTELQGAYNDAAVLTAIKLHGVGASVARIPETTACKDCLRLFLQDGKPIVFKVIDLIKNGANIGVPPSQWKPTVWPLHPRCHPAGTLVMTAEGERPIEQVTPGMYVLAPSGALREVTHAWRSQYTGPLTALSAQGRTLRSTPQHLLLRSTGTWAPAETVEKGGHLLGIQQDVGVSGLLSNLDSVQRPPLAQEERQLLHVLTGLPRGGVPVSAIYFDGELFFREGDVDVEDVKGESREGAQPDLAQRIADALFIRGAHLAGTTLCLPDTVFVWHRSSTQGIVGGSRPGETLLGSGLLHTLDHGLPASALDVPCAPETLHDDVAGNAILLSEVFDRELLVQVFVNNVINGKRNTRGHEKAPGVPGSRQVTVTTSAKIVNVASEAFSGVVYNLTVAEEESYFAELLGSHNCRCGLVPVPDGYSVDRAGNVAPDPSRVRQ